MTIVNTLDPSTPMLMDGPDVLARAREALRLRADGIPAKGNLTWVRLWGRCEPTPSGCWEYLGHRNPDGYGNLRLNGRMEKAHRVAWALAHGDPGALHVLHRCDNPPCCNSAHLFVGTNHDNVLDRQAKGRSRGTFQATPLHPATLRAGQAHWKAKLSGADVAAIRSRHEAGELQTSLGRAFNVHPATVSRIVRRVWRQEVA